MAGKFFNLSDKLEERQMIRLMLGVGFFMGVFNATYQVVADAIFLKRLPHQLNSAFLTAGVLGILACSPGCKIKYDSPCWLQSV
jgi:AAA family ATP:ADP antiporter